MLAAKLCLDANGASCASRQELNLTSLITGLRGSLVWSRKSTNSISWCPVRKSGKFWSWCCTVLSAATDLLLTHICVARGCDTGIDGTGCYGLRFANHLLKSPCITMTVPPLRTLQCLTCLEHFNFFLRIARHVWHAAELEHQWYTRVLICGELQRKQCQATARGHSHQNIGLWRNQMPEGPKV